MDVHRRHRPADNSSADDTCPQLSSTAGSNSPHEDSASFTGVSRGPEMQSTTPTPTPTPTATPPHTQQYKTASEYAEALRQWMYQCQMWHQMNWFYRNCHMFAPTNMYAPWMHPPMFASPDPSSTMMFHPPPPPQPQAQPRAQPPGPIPTPTPTPSGQNQNARAAEQGDMFNRCKMNFKLCTNNMVFITLKINM